MENLKKFPSISEDMFNNMEKFKVSNLAGITGGSSGGYTSAGITVYADGSPSTKDSESSSSD